MKIVCQGGCDHIILRCEGCGRQFTGKEKRVTRLLRLHIQRTHGKTVDKTKIADFVSAIQENGPLLPDFLRASANIPAVPMLRDVCHDPEKAVQEHTK